MADLNTTGPMGDAAGTRRAKTSKRFAAAAAGAGEQFVDWVRTHVPAVLLLALVCAMALVALFYFTAFSDFGASADFVYNQF